MTNKLKFALAYIRTAQTEPIEFHLLQRVAINNYAEEQGYIIAQYVEHKGRNGDVYDFEWLSETLKQNTSISYLILYSSDRFSNDPGITQVLIDLLATKYKVIFDTVVKEPNYVSKIQ